MGTKAMSRYEMAALVARILKVVDEKGSPVPADAAPPGTAAQGVSPNDLAAVRKLVDEYKTELVIIGADLKDIKDELARVTSDPADVHDKIAPLEATVMSLKARFRH